VTSSSKLPVDRLAIGQILGRLLYQFRSELFDSAEAAGRFRDIRLAHLQVWGNIGIAGIRLTDLAAKAHLSLAACSELVDELQELGYLERQPDPSDGRAKLLFPTAKGRGVLDAAGLAVADLEQRWRAQLPPGTFDRACHTFNDLIGALASEDKVSRP
jgi:DNA-binding MarR family transcriptional regulator